MEMLKPFLASSALFSISHEDTTIIYPNERAARYNTLN
jgi:hypothetical protein